MRIDENGGDVTLQAMIGERFMPRLDLDAYSDDVATRARVQTWVAEHSVGGFCIFGGTADMVIRATSELQEIAMLCNRIPLLFSADCEWGLPMRLRESGTEFPDAMAIAHARDTKLTFEIGAAIASEMRAVGIGWNFAPVADVNSNPRNPIINTRAFSDDPEEAAIQVTRMLEGIQSKRVAATAKHFPGHGDTMVDSHRGLPTIHGALEAFEVRELIPFAHAISAGVKSVMLGHIAVPELTSDVGGTSSDAELPASLSRPIIQNLLRGCMNFRGVIVTDALEMHSITNRYGAAEATLLAAKAGVDVLLMPADVENFHAALLRAAENGELDRDELVQSYERIQELKKWIGTQVPEAGSASAILASRAHLKLAERAAVAAIVVSGESRKLRTLERIVVLCDDRPATIRKAKLFLSMLSAERQLRDGEIRLISDVMSGSEDFARADHTLLTIFHRARGYLGGQNTDVTMPDCVRTIASRIREAGTVLGGLLLVGSPYLDLEFGDRLPNVVVKTFSESGASIEAVVKLFMVS